MTARWKWLSKLRLKDNLSTKMTLIPCSKQFKYLAFLFFSWKNNILKLNIFQICVTKMSAAKKISRLNETSLQISIKINFLTIAAIVNCSKNVKNSILLSHTCFPRYSWVLNSKSCCSSPSVNFTNILLSTFGPIFLRQKNYKAKM